MDNALNPKNHTLTDVSTMNWVPLDVKCYFSVSNVEVAFPEKSPDVLVMVKGLRKADVVSAYCS